MEGVVYSLKDCLEIIKGMGIDTSEVRASGGGGRSGLWRQMQADVFGVDINTINSSEGPALGAALLAGAGTGVYGSVPEACEAVIKVKDTKYPDMAKNAKYSKYYAIYGQIYGALKDKFAEIASF